MADDRTASRVGNLKIASFGTSFHSVSSQLISSYAKSKACCASLAGFGPRYLECSLPTLAHQRPLRMSASVSWQSFALKHPKSRITADLKFGFFNPRYTSCIPDVWHHGQCMVRSEAERIRKGAASFSPRLLHVTPYCVVSELFTAAAPRSGPGLSVEHMFEVALLPPKRRRG